MTLSRRQFLYGSACAGTALFLSTFIDGTRVVMAVPIPGGTLEPGSIVPSTGRHCSSRRSCPVRGRP